MSQQPETPTQAPLSLSDELRALRDEIRLELHLAGMEAKEAWKRLEPRIRDAEGKVERSVSSATHAALRELTESVREFRASLRSPKATEQAEPEQLPAHEEALQRKTGS